MIKSITVTNYLGDSIKLELGNPEESGFIVKSIDGLGPGKATINSSEISTTDGSFYNSSRISSRNIVISLLFLPKETIEDTRQRSYKYFPIKRKVTLLVETDNRIGEISGYVESNEPDIFSKEEGSDISIICPDPFFYSVSNTITSFGRVEPLFEFPFSNESLTEPLIEFSEIRTHVDRDIIYVGDMEIGITMRIRANGPVSDITVYNIGTGESMHIDTSIVEKLSGGGFDDGDEIVICTVTGKKSATLIREGASTNILNSISKESNWFKISKGLNKFAYKAVSGQDNLQFEIENRIAYEGV